MVLAALTMAPTVAGRALVGFEDVDFIVDNELVEDQSSGRQLSPAKAVGGAVTRMCKEDEFCKNYWWTPIVGVVILLIVILLIICYCPCCKKCKSKCKNKCEKTDWNKV